MATTWGLDAYTVLQVQANGTMLPGVVYDPPSAGSPDLIWVEILDNTLHSQGAIEFISISATLYFNAVGSWTILCPFSETLWNMMMSGDFFVNVNWRGMFTFGGKCETPGYQDSLPNSVAAAQYPGPFIQLTGADWLGLIANRICYPAPGSAWTSQLGTSADKVTNMPLESAIKHYVNGNIGPGAGAGRRNSYLAVATDQARGPNVTYSVNFGTNVDLNLLDVINALITGSSAAATPANMGFQIIRNPLTHMLTFDVYIPSNLTSKAYFSETLGNVNAINFGLTDPTCTCALVQGAATTGTASVFIEQDSSAMTMWNRVETYINDASESTLANLNTDAATALAQGQFGPIMQITTNDLPFMTFGRDYYLGDLVTVQIQISGIANITAATYTDIISGVTLTADPAQTPMVTVVPVVGNSNNPTATNTNAIAQLSARIKALEQRLAGRA